MTSRVCLVGLVCVVGCSDYGFHGKATLEEGAENTAAAAISVSPDPVDFGTRSDTAPVSRVLTIANIGTDDLRIEGVRLDGPAVFEVTEPDAGTVAPGDSTTLVVTYSPTSVSESHRGRIDVSSNAVDRPTASVEVLGAVELQELDSGDPGPDESETCECPEGFETVDGDDTLCFRETETPATPTGDVVEVCAITPYSAYGKFGVRYPGGTIVRDAYWGQDDGVPNGRLNEVGVWGCESPGSPVAGSAPVGSWIGFSVCVDVPGDGDYMLALGGDNRVRFAVDGVQVMEQTDDDTRNFNYWWMHVVSLAAGTHIIDVEGYNAGSIAAFGAELSGPFSAGSLASDADLEAADYDGHIIWATQDALGSAFPIGDGVSWTCPDGAILEGCDEPVCVEREEVPCER